MTRDQLIEEVKFSDCVDGVGAGFPAGMKWSFLDQNLTSPSTSFAMPTKASPVPLKIATCGAIAPPAHRGMMYQATPSVQKTLFISAVNTCMLRILEKRSKRHTQPDFWARTFSAPIIHWTCMFIRGRVLTSVAKRLPCLNPWKANADSTPETTVSAIAGLSRKPYGGE